jgi:hypothetical protein
VHLEIKSSGENDNSVQDQELERVKYLIALQSADRQCRPQGSIQSRPSLPFHGRDPGPNSRFPGTSAGPSDGDATAFTPCQQHFGESDVVCEGRFGLQKTLTVCKGCGAVLDGVRVGKGAELKYVCAECNILFEAEPLIVGRDNLGFPAAKDGAQISSILRCERTDKINASETNQPLVNLLDRSLRALRKSELFIPGGDFWGLKIKACGHGLVVSGHSRLRLVVDSVSCGSVASSAGLQVFVIQHQNTAGNPLITSLFRIKTASFE